MTNDQTENCTGEFLAHGKGFRLLRIRLESGQEVEGVIPVKTIQKLGLLAGSLAGWKVRVSLKKSPKMARIVELRPPSSMT